MNRRCVTGNGLYRCQLDEGHDGMHYARIGAGSSSWSAPFPEWDGQLGRYVRPGEPEYDVFIERLRSICSRNVREDTQHEPARYTR